MSTTSQRPGLVIIGPGKVGRALGVLAARGGWPVAAVGGRNRQRAAKAAAAISPDVQVGSPAEVAAAGRLILLTVSDDAVRSVCEQLAAAGAFASGAIVAHCCGALDSEVLASAKDKCGCLVASCHPLQTFPTVEAAMDRLAGAYFFCEGDEAALAVLDELVELIGGVAVRIPPGGDRKALYHAGAVMACNSVTALMDAAKALLVEQAGIDGDVAGQALAILMRATVENIAAMGPEAALTGPVARGDVDTVRRHLEAFSDTDTDTDQAGREKRANLKAFYCAAALWTVELARRKGTLDKAAAQTLRQLLQ